MVVDGYNVIIREDGSVVVSEWTQTGYEITNGEITVKVGDYVLNYDEGTGSTQIETTESGHTEQQTLATEDLGWRILGIGENGGLEVISDNPTTATSIDIHPVLFSSLSLNPFFKPSLIKIYAKNPPAIIPKSTHKDIPKLEVPPLSHLPRLPMSANR